MAVSRCSATDSPRAVASHSTSLGQHASSGIAKETHKGFGLFQGSPGNSRVVPDKEKKMTVAVSHICRISFSRVFRILEGSGFSCGL